MKDYKKKELVTFSVNINQKMVDNKWKKQIKFPPEWTSLTLDKTYYNKNMNGIALLTGKVNNIIVIDIDDVDHWTTLLKKHKKKEPNTVKVVTGSGGLHYYFEYENIDKVKSKDHCFGKDYNIDIKTDGGCVIAPPTSYINKNVNKKVEYKWDKSIFDTKPKKLPKWIKDLLLDSCNVTKSKKKVVNKKTNTIIQQNNDNNDNTEQVPVIQEVDDTEINQDYTTYDIIKIVDMFGDNRCNTYNDWINVGICLYNINIEYMLIWDKWSSKNEKYMSGECDKKWKTFKKDKSGLGIGSLLLWAKTDNPYSYNEFMQLKKKQSMILKKYPNDNIVLGETTKIGETGSYTDLKNNVCFIKGKPHKDMEQSMYMEIVDKFMTIKCKHNECYSKTYPCGHILLTKNEMNVFYGNNITIINNIENDDDYNNFNHLNLYDDDILNKLITTFLNDGSNNYCGAEIIYHLYQHNFYYGEDGNWYKLKNNRWTNIQKSPSELINKIPLEIKNIFNDIIYKFGDILDKKQIAYIKQATKKIGEYTFIMDTLSLLTNLFTERKNNDRDFVKKLDQNRNIIAFNFDK